MKPKIVLVGVGRFGKNHLRVLKELEREKFCVLHGVVDVNTSILEEVSKNYKVRTSTTINDWMNDIDAVDIVTPTNTHFNISRKCLEAGKHVLVEKPLTTNYAETKELVQIATERNKILMTGHIFRYNKAVRKIKSLIDERELGDIFYIFGHFMGISNPRNDTGVIFNLMIHHIDLYNYLLNILPNTLISSAGHFLGRQEYEDLAILTMKYPNNVLGVIESSWMYPGKQRDITIVGSKKSITCDLLNQIIEIHDISIKNIDDEKYIALDNGSNTMNIDYIEPLKLELLDFIESITFNKIPQADAKSALDAVLISELALVSSKKNMELNVNDWI